MTFNQRNAAIADYITETFVTESQALVAAKQSTLQKGIPDIAIPKAVGKLLSVLCAIHKPSRILEVGTLTGYSTLWLAENCPEASITTLEFDPKHAMIARQNFAFANREINLIEGDAELILQHLIDAHTEPYDLIFLDADKDSYPVYLELLLKLSKKGTLLLCDNLIPREERINRPKKEDRHAQAIYTFNTMLAKHPRLETILIPTIVENWGRIDALGLSLVVS